MKRLLDAIKTGQASTGAYGKPEPAFGKSKKIPKANTGGDCYEAAGRYFMDEAIRGKVKGLRLVHGEVTGQGPIAGIKFGHAWVEDGDFVIDKSNGRDLQQPKVFYYAIGHIKRTVKYDVEAFRERVGKYKHWGPWDLKTEY